MAPNNPAHMAERNQNLTNTAEARLSAWTPVIPPVLPDTSLSSWTSDLSAHLLKLPRQSRTDFKRWRLALEENMLDNEPLVREVLQS